MDMVNPLPVWPYTAMLVAIATVAMATVSMIMAHFRSSYSREVTHGVGPLLSEGSKLVHVFCVCTPSIGFSSN